ncbi:MAG: DUF2019 domain-containing protein [Lachnospiraceae bacterium]|jgi:hypothetical protein|nr:DUF2019 domain-containing protein [Lachnospiraceae bacterium]
MNLGVRYYIYLIEELGIKMSEARANDDRNATKYNKLFKERQIIIDNLHNNVEMARDVYKELLNSKNSLTLVNTSANCLRLGVFVDEAISILENLSKKSLGEDSFNAKIVLKVYRGEYLGSHL